MNRALPNWANDLIHNGVPKRDLKAIGYEAVERAIYKLSVSAVQRGWDAMELRAEIEDRRYLLGHQAAIKAGKLRTPKALARTYANLWDRAHVFVSENPPYSSEDAREEADERATLVELILKDAETPILPGDRKVLAFAATEARRRGMLKVALPWRSVHEATEVTERGVKSAFNRLDRAGLLVRYERGHASETPGLRKAATFLLLPAAAEHPYLCPRVGPVGPPAVAAPRPVGHRGSAIKKTAGTPRKRRAPRPMGHPDAAEKPVNTSAELKRMRQPMRDDLGAPLGQHVLDVPPAVLRRLRALAADEGINLDVFLKKES